MAYKVFLMGGVGNQLFQLSRAISLQLKDKNVIVHELGMIKKIIYKLIGHSIHENWINMQEFSRHLGLNYKKTNILELVQLFIIFFLRKLSIKNNFDLSLSQRISSQNKFDVGYFQEKKHFNKKAQFIILDALKKILQKDLIKNPSKKIISLHIRGGDFLKYKNNHHLNIKNSLVTIEKFLKKIDPKIFKIKIITNDKIILNSMNLINVEIVSGNPKDDFLSLVNCSQMYVSQSSFCFWAYLFANKFNDCKIVNKENWIYKNLL